MKQLILVIFFFIATQTLKAQVIDSSITFITAVKIVPFKAKYTDTINTSLLGVRIVSDDLKSSCQLYWQLLTAKGQLTIEGNDVIAGEDYKNWNGSNLYPYTFLATKYKLTFAK
jgi:hypothetical protein